MLFNVSGTNVFLCGSLHLLPPDAKLPRRVFEVVNFVEDCVFEVDMANFREPEFSFYADGESLSQHVPAPLLDATARLWKSLGFIAPLLRFKPWRVGQLMGVGLIKRAWNPVTPGVDSQVLDTAKRAGKRLFVLEAIEAALHVSDQAPLSEQLLGLKLVTSDPNYPVQVVNRLYAGWSAADVAAIGRELQTYSNLAPISARGLITERNQTWLPQVLSGIQGNRRALFVVGALHLAGEYGLLQLLASRGYPCRTVQ